MMTKAFILLCFLSHKHFCLQQAAARYLEFSCINSQYCGEWSFLFLQLIALWNPSVSSLLDFVIIFINCYVMIMLTPPLFLPYSSTNPTSIYQWCHSESLHSFSKFRLFTQWHLYHFWTRNILSLTRVL